MQLTIDYAAAAESAQQFCGLSVITIPASMATELVVKNHYLHRRPPICHAFGLLHEHIVKGVVTFGIPPSRHLQKSACPSAPGYVIELNRLWVSDELKRNTESWFVSRAIKLLGSGLIIVSYADTAAGHVGYIYRALNFNYAGWTDMERKTPRLDYVAHGGKHSRDSMRNGYSHTERRQPKVKYWLATDKRTARLCPWPKLDWRIAPPPTGSVEAP